MTHLGVVSKGLMLHAKFYTMTCIIKVLVIIAKS